MTTVVWGATLTPNLKIYVEYSNEVMNDAFADDVNHMITMATSLGITGGDSDFVNPATRLQSIARFDWIKYKIMAFYGVKGTGPLAGGSEGGQERPGAPRSGAAPFFIHPRSRHQHGAQLELWNMSKRFFFSFLAAFSFFLYGVSSSFLSFLIVPVFFLRLTPLLLSSFFSVGSFSSIVTVRS